MKRIREANADITLLQEVWEPSQLSIDVVGKNKLLKVRKGEGGGGTMVSWKDGTLVQASLEKALNRIQ